MICPVKYCVGIALHIAVKSGKEGKPCIWRGTFFRTKQPNIKGFWGNESNLNKNFLVDDWKMLNLKKRETVEWIINAEIRKRQKKR